MLGVARISQASSAAVSRNPVARWDSWADSEPSEAAAAHQCTGGLTPGLFLVLRLLLLSHGAWTQVFKDCVPTTSSAVNGCQSFGWRDRPEACELGSTGSYGQLCTIYSCQAVRPCRCVLLGSQWHLQDPRLSSHGPAKKLVQPSSCYLKPVPRLAFILLSNHACCHCLHGNHPLLPFCYQLSLNYQKQAKEGHSSGVFTRPMLQHQGRWCGREPRQFCAILSHLLT